MKFDVIIGNPPYQINDEGKRVDGSQNASASPIYPAFVEEAMKISDIQSLIIPARWTTGAGKGIAGFSQQMLEKNSFKQFNHYVNARDIFPDNEIPGGICYFIHDNSYTGNANIEVSYNGKTEESTRLLDEHSIGIFIPFEDLSNILLKVKKKENLNIKNMQQIVSGRKPYGLGTDFFNSPEKYGIKNVSDKRQNNDDIEIFGLHRRTRTSKFIPKNSELPQGKELIDYYKVFLPYAYGGGGAIGESTEVLLLGTPIKGEPHQISTETYLNIGKFKTYDEASALYKYIKTKFFRVLVGILKSTQHATRTFGLVPLQDFTSESDIDWTQSVENIDKQLYRKYNLNDSEIMFIETNIKEME